MTRAIKRISLNFEMEDAREMAVRAQLEKCEDFENQVQKGETELYSDYCARIESYMQKRFTNFTQAECTYIFITKFTIELQNDRTHCSQMRDNIEKLFENIHNLHQLFDMTTHIES